MKIRKSITTPLVLVIVFFIISFVVFYKIFSNNIESSANEHLTTISSLKKNALENFLENIELSMLSIDQLPITRELFQSTCAQNTSDGCARFSDYFTVFDATENIDGLYFFNNEGELFFHTHTNPEETFGDVISEMFDKQSVQKGSVFLPVKTKRSKKNHHIFFSDMFKDDSDTPYMFVLLARYDSENKLEGSVIGQISIPVIDKIFDDQTGLRNSGETYIIGSDLVMRTNTRFSEEKTRLAQITNTKNAQNCIGQKEQTREFYPNYSGANVLGVYQYIPQLDWCLLSEMNENELTKVQNLLIKIEFLLGIIFSGVLFFFFEKIVAKTKSLRKKQKELTEALFEKEKFEQAVNTASDNISIIDEKGNVLYMNKALVKNTGFEIEKSIGKNIKKLWWSQTEKERVGDILKTISVDKKPGQWELNANKKNKEIFPSEIFITPILGDAGEFLFALVIEHDIRERKALENQKNEFISIASHELRTPMTIIRGYIGLLSDGSLGKVTQKQKDILGKIDSNSKKLIEMVKDMLDITKLESQNKYEIEKAPLDIKDILGEVSIEFQPLLLEKNINYSTHSETDSNITSDKTLIKRLLINIIGNAIKFTENDGEISVSIKPSNNNNNIRIEIADSGIGIPKDQRDLVFKKFAQVESSLSNKRIDGTGLGLAICKQVIEILEGEIDFESEPGVGSTFFFEIPRK